MNKFIKIIIFSILIFVTAACSYKPIFIEKSYDFKIEEIIFSGDRIINSNINRKLKFKKDNEKIYKKSYVIYIDTRKEKNIISKNSEGDPSKFEILIKTNYEIINEQKTIIKRSIKQKNIYNNESDKFKLEQSEKIIIENLSEKISDTIISSIINLNDN